MILGGVFCNLGAHTGGQYTWIQVIDLWFWERFSVTLKLILVVYISECTIKTDGLWSSIINKSPNFLNKNFKTSLPLNCFVIIALYLPHMCYPDTSVPFRWFSQTHLIHRQYTNRQSKIFLVIYHIN